MKHLFVIITSSRNKSEIDSCKYWLEKEDHIFLGDINIDELNMIGFYFDSGVSHEINHRLYNLFLYKRHLLSMYDWVTFLDDSSYVFLDLFYKGINRRSCGIVPRIIGNDYFGQCNFFINRHAFGEVVNKNIFNMKNGISVNSSFLKRTVDFIGNLKKNDRYNFLNEILLDDMFFHVISEKLSAKKHFVKNRLYINYYDNIEGEFDNLSIISGLNAIEKDIINRVK